MDNNELDRILKEKLKGKINPSLEMQDKIRQKVELEKKARLSRSENDNQETDNKNANYKVIKQDKPKKYKKLKSITSIAAMVLIIFTMGIVLNKNFLNSEETIVNVATITAVEPTKLKNGILANDSEFIIYADGNDINKESVQKSLYIEPALDYTIEKTSNKNEYKLKFKQNIPDNTIVKLQYVKNQITENSWAYQTSNKLSVSKTYPANNEDQVSKNSIIEIEFSYASVENLQDYVTISPKTEGTWEHLGKIWRFTPKAELKEETKYTITINKGITAEGETLENEYIFNFIVNESDNGVSSYDYDSISIDGINTYKSDERVNIYYTKNYETKTEIAKIEISKFNNTEDFIEYVKTKNYQKAESQGEYEFEQNKNYLQLRKTLQNGYYVASIKSSKGKEIFNCPIQINDLSAYALESERDVLVWVASGNDLAKGIKVEYQGKEQKTNEQGIAKFERVADGSSTIKYLTLGNTENKLVVGIYNYSLRNYPSAYLYTDRPLYKNTDTINIWGFVPRELFYDKIEDEFYIELNDEGKKKVEVSEDGNLNYKIELNNHVDYEYANITLYYKDTSIASRAVTIENYELQNYTYETILDKNYVYAGEDFEFDVKVNHITGLSVPNKSVVVKCGENVYKETTGEDGIAHFTINTDNYETSDFTTEPRYLGIDIYNGDLQEYTDIEQFTSIYILNRSTYTKIEEPEENKYKITLYKLASDKNTTNVEYNLAELYDGIYDTNVEISLKETTQRRYISGYTYNEYTKENEPEYEYDYTENTEKIKTITTQNGTFEFNANELNFKKNTEELSYQYELEFTYKDTKGQKVVEEQYIYLGDIYSDTTLGYYHDEWDLSSDLLYEPGSKINYMYYYTYRYLLTGKTSENFSVGDTINLKLAESISSGVKDIKNEGKILKIVLQEEIKSTEIIENDEINYTFTDDDFPGCKITTAYFYNGRFYRMPIYYFDFDEESRKIDIEISADKTEYKPGDKVTLTIKTTNNGTPIKSFVNISVVNEAIFNSMGDETNLLETIYEDKAYPIYTYSTYGDYIGKEGGGGGGGGGEPRGDFGDTAHFETIYTDSKGMAKVTFTLPDNVTTYRVTVHSANKDLYLGVNKINIVSKLDFFVQSTQPRNVKTTDDLVLNATSIADEKYDVEYEFTIKELNKTLTATGTTNNPVTVNFGKLPYGTYHAVTKGKHEDQEDSIEYEFNIVESTQEVQNKTTININNNTRISPTKNPIVLEIYNKNMSTYLKYIEFIESTATERLDTQIAYNEVQSIRDKYYGTESTTNYIDLYKYQGDEYLKNLENGEDDIVLTALTSFYARQYASNYYGRNDRSLNENDNIFEIYLLAAANNEPVLTDLLYLKEENDIENYNKLLVTLSLEFVGDFQNAKDLYKSIKLTDEEAEEHKSIIAIIDTFINKQEAVNKIDELIQNNPADEYLRFAILSFFENSSAEIEEESTIKITSANLNETITLNGMQVKTYTIYNEDLNDINFETSSDDIMVSYYYHTSLDNIESKNISKDIKISIDGTLKKGNVVNLIIEFEENYNDENGYNGEVRVSLPNSLRLAQIYDDMYYDNEYYVQNNQIDYLSIFKNDGCSRIEIPLIVTLDGNYKFENVVFHNNEIYHISNSLDLNISK